MPHPVRPQRTIAPAVLGAEAEAVAQAAGGSAQIEQEALPPVDKARVPALRKTHSRKWALMRRAR
jgi:hypothetical protein